jgi:hypothetical protein
MRFWTPASSSLWIAFSCCIFLVTRPVHAAAPPNDHFTNRFALSGALVITNVSISQATLEPGEPAGASNVLSTVWFEWTAPSQGVVKITADATANIHVFRGTTLATLIRMFSDYPSPSPYFTLFAEAGEKYQIRLSPQFTQSLPPIDLRIELFGTPPNDHFASRTALVGSNILASGSNFVAASHEPDEPHLLGGLGRTVWWTWTAPTSGVVSLSTTGTFQTVLGVFTGTSLDALSTVYTYPYSPETTFYTLAGQTYQFAVDGFVGQYGYISLQLNLTPLARAPNDDFADRAVLTGTDFTIVGSDVAATREPDEPQHSNYPGQRSVWFTWTAPFSGGVRFNISGTNHNPGLGIYTGSTLAALQRVASFPCFSQSCALGFAVTAGTAYQIAIEGTYGAAGDFTFHIDLTPAAANDHFADRLILSSFPASITATNTYATQEPGEPGHSVFEGSGRSVWFSWTAAAPGTVTFDVRTPNGAYVKMLGVYTGTSVSNLTTITNQTISATVNTIPGTTYQIAVDGYDGPFTLRIVPPPPNDDFANRITVAGTNIAFTGTSRGATEENGEPNPDPFNAYFHRSVWWTWTAPTSGLVRVSIYSPPEYIQMILAIYTGSSLGTLENVAVGKYTGEVRFYALQGTTYQIRAEGFGGSSGDLNLGLQLNPPPQTSARGSMRLPNGQFRVRVNGPEDQQFVIQASTNLIHWNSLSTNILSQSYLDFTDTQATTFGRRFYRVLWLP